MRYTPVEIRRYLSGHQQSGLTVRAYCKQHSLNYWTFREWRKRISDIHPPAAVPFVKINLPTSSFLEIVTGTKATIRVPADMEPATAWKLLSAVKRSRIV